MPATILSVEYSSAGMRIDKWLSEQVQSTSRAQIQRWISDGRVLVNDQQPKLSYRVATGDKVRIQPPALPADAATLIAEPLPLEIVWEDEDCIVINKPPHVAVHPGAGRTTGTIVNALLYYFPSVRGVGDVDRPGIVHRLDMDTSGAMVIAKHDIALRHLQQQFRSRSVYKEYLALLEGRLEPAQGRIEAPIARQPGGIRRKVSFQKDKIGRQRPRPAITDYEIDAVYAAPIRDANAVGMFSFVRAHPITGRTHQIRVHFAWLKHPIVGDPMYGLRRQRIETPRMFLHAHRLKFKLLNGDMQEVEVALPEDLKQVINRLESDR